MSNDQSLRLPNDPNAVDIFLAVIRGILSELPVVGGAVVELLALIIAPPLQRRKEQFLEKLANDYVILKQQYAELTPEALRDNEQFVTVFLQAANIAIRNHQEEKLQALRNAVLNSPLPNSPDDTRQLRFIQLIDRFSPMHIMILRVFKQKGGNIPSLELNDPDFMMNIALDRLVKLIIETYPELASQVSDDYEIFIQVIKDLQSEGLIANKFPEYDLLTRISDRPEITKLGQEFLSFIRSPIDKNEYLDN